MIKKHLKSKSTRGWRASIFHGPMIALCLFLITDCGVFVGNPGDKDEDNPSVVTPNPTGPTSQQTDVSLSLQSTTPVAPTLNLAPTVDLGNGLIIREAIVHIGRFKLKTERATSEFEVELETELEEAEQQEAPEGEEAKEAEIDQIESKYDSLIAIAQTDIEKETLEQQEDDEKEGAEKTLAVQKDVAEKKVEEVEDQKDYSLKWKSAYYYNIVNNTIEPKIENLAISSGSYPRIEFKLKPSRSTTDNLGMINKSVLISGTATIANQEVPFNFSMRQGLELSLKGQGALVVEKGVVAQTLIISFNLQTWFAGIDFSKATISTRGNVKINAVENAAIFTKIVKNIKRSTRYGEDRDGDGDLGDNESEGDGVEQVEEEEAAEGG